MKRLSFMSVSFAVLILFVLFGTLAIGSQVKQADLMGPGASPKIIMDRVPLESPNGMKVYRIQALQVQQSLIEKLSRVHNFEITPSVKKDGAKSAVMHYFAGENGFTRLIVNNDRGHMDLMPNLGKLKKTEINLLKEDMARQMAVNYAAEMQLIPPDSSRLNPAKVVTLAVSSTARENSSPSIPKLQTVLFQRTLDGKNVFGDGSQFTVSMGDKGNVEGFQRKLNRLEPEPGMDNISFLTAQEVYDKIEAMLRREIKGNVEIQVETPQLAYYGRDSQYVQPAYLFTAVIISNENKEKSYYAGVVEAMQNPPEPVNDPRQEISLSTSSTPLTPSQVELSGEGPSRAYLASVSVGRYVVREDSSDWMDDANDFKRGLENGHCSGCSTLTFPQFYWNEPRLFTTEDNYWVDQCHIVLMEGHGDHWLFTTRGNCCDIVYLNSGSQPGYGGNAGGVMAYLILKGCDIIPSPIDVSNWADPWWRIFKGLHQAIGFRTTMYINDDISDNFGESIGNNGNIVDSWFAATNSCFSYQWQRLIGGDVPGYGSVVMITGHQGDGIYYTAPAPNADSAGLTIWYQY